MAKKIKLPVDTNKRAKSIVDALTAEPKVKELTEEELLKRVTITASNMKGDEVLKATAFGRKLKYSIK